jgi:hypothetical protein
MKVPAGLIPAQTVEQLKSGDARLGAIRLHAEGLDGVAVAGLWRCRRLAEAIADLRAFVRATLDAGAGDALERGPADLIVGVHELLASVQREAHDPPADP